MENVQDMIKSGGRLMGGGEGEGEGEGGSSADDNETNFQQAGVTIEACTKIYEKRVENTHQSCYRMRETLSRTDDKGEGEAKDDADAGGEDGADAAPKAVRRRPTNSSTLEKKPENITIGAGDRPPAVDPMFNNISSTFDEGGARGMILANFGVLHGCALVFGAQAHDASAEVVTQNTVNVTSLRTLWREQQALHGNAEDLALCPEIEPILSQVAKLTGVAMSGDAAATAADGDAGEQFEGGWGDANEEDDDALEPSFRGGADDDLDDSDRGGDMYDDNGFGYDDDSDGGMELDGDTGNNGAMATAGSGSSSSSSSSRGNEPTILENPVGYIDQEWLNSWQTRSKGRRRNCHWKPQGAADKDGANKDGAEGTEAAAGASKKKTRKRASKKDKFFVDFTAAPVNVKVAFAKPKSKTANLMTKAALAKAEASCSDLHLTDTVPYSVEKDLTSLFLKNFFVQPLTSAGQRRIVAQAAQAAGSSVDMGGEGGNEDGEEGGFDCGGFMGGNGMMDGGDGDDDDSFGEAPDYGPHDDGDDSFYMGGMEGGMGGGMGVGMGGGAMVEADGLIAAPRMVQKLNIKYATSAKRVDVKLLKSTMWDHIDDTIEEKAEETEGGEEKVRGCEGGWVGSGAGRGGGGGWPDRDIPDRGIRRERERDRQRHTRQRHTERKRARQTETYMGANRPGDRQRHKDTNRQTQRDAV
jgi:condensin complex subunit 2